MQLTAFRVFKYRNVVDSGLVRLADQLTCIVGKNQSGKTNLLKALQKLNPHDKSVKYDVRSDWPRGGRRAKDGTQVVCEAHFTLGAEKDELSQLLDAPVEITKAIVTKNYSGQYAVTFPEHPDLFPKRVAASEVKRVSDKLTVPDMPVGEAFFRAAGECVEEARQTAQQRRFANLAVLADLHRQKLQSAGSTEYPHSSNETQFVSRYLGLLTQIGSELAALPTTDQLAQDCIVRSLPTFIYMDDYLSFEGTANLDQVAQRRNHPTPQDDTLHMIFSLSGLDLDKLIEQGNSLDPATIRERQYDLQDAAEFLTRQVAARWVQDPYKIQFRADGQRFFTEIEELDKNIGMLPLEEQSKGFQWFFSFDLRFMHDSGGTFAGCVLLLDEPGMHLHPGGQDDLLQRFDAYARDNTLIYTTHLPFLVDIREPSRILIMKENEDYSASVTDNLGGSGPNEKLTMQAALGMKASQHQLAAEKNLVVAGPDAYAILHALSNLLERSGRIGLDENVTLLAADDPAGMPYLVSFLIGQGLEVVAMFESNAQGRAAEEKLRTKWLRQFKDTQSSTVLLGDALGLPGDISVEDMFSDRHYLSKATEVHTVPMQRAGAKTINLPTGPGTLLERVAQGFADAEVKFDKDAVSRLIRRQLREQRRIFFLSDISGETTNKAERLFAYLNAKFSA